MRRNIEKEIDEIEKTIESLKKVGLHFKNELDKTEEKEVKEELKYRILTVLYLIEKLNKDKEKYKGFVIRKWHTTIETNKNIETMLRKHLRTLKKYREDPERIETIIKYGKADVLKTEYNFEEEDIDFIIYVIRNYKNIRTEVKKR